MEQLKNYKILVSCTPYFLKTKFPYQHKNSNEFKITRDELDLHWLDGKYAMIHSKPNTQNNNVPAQEKKGGAKKGGAKKILVFL